MTQIPMTQRIAGAVLALAALTAPAQAQDWFQHQFGEMRAFHGDWLAVCADQGAGACRLVQTSKDPGSGAFFDQRLSVHRIDGSPDWAVEVMSRGMPEAAVTSLTFMFGADAVFVTPGAWIVGDLQVPNVAETITVMDPAIANEIVERMRAGNRLTVIYEPAGAGRGQIDYSLRGVTAATDAINAQVLARQE